MTLDEQGNPIPEKPTLEQPLPPRPVEKFKGLVHEIERAYVKSQNPRPLKDAVHAGFSFLTLGIAFLQRYPEDREFCMRRLQFVQECKYPRLRRTLAISADRIPVMVIESEGIKSRHLVPPLDSRPFEEPILDELLANFYDSQLLPEIQAMAIRLMDRGILRREAEEIHDFDIEGDEDEGYDDDGNQGETNA